jgi:NTE family protein
LYLEAEDMIGKFRSENISRRGALLGFPVALGIVAAPTVLRSSDTDVQTAAAVPGRPKVALALQGGGSHGAFTWGVLDRLPDDVTIDIIGVTGTSAGAMNAAVLVDGLVRGGPEQARAELQKYWEAVGEMPGLGTLFSNISGEKAATTPLESIPAYVEAMKKNLSPYDLPPANDNPMRRLLTDLIDFDRLRSQKEIQLTVCATNARTARRRVFTDNDLSVEALLASACLPQLFRAVDIDGEPYWDGALTGNPALGPLLTRRPDCDLIIVRVDPVNRPEAPRSQRDILNRTVEISHNSTFWLELGAIAVVLRFVDEARSPFRRVRFHIIEASPIMERFPMSSKLNNYPPLLEYLFNLGRQTGDAWIAQNREALGQRSTMDVQRLLPGSIWDNI